MVLSIIATVLTVAIIVTSAAGIGESQSIYYYYHSDDNLDVSSE